MTSPLIRNSSDEVTTAPRVNVTDRLFAHAKLAPERAAILDPSGPKQTGEKYRRWTFAELAHEVEQLTAGLLDSGIQPAQRIALLVPMTERALRYRFKRAIVQSIESNKAHKEQP